MILYTQNYERQILVNKQPFFKAKWPYSLHIFSLVSLVKKYATCKPIWPFKKAVYSHGSTIHSFFCPIIHFFYNECGKGTFFNFLETKIIMLSLLWDMVLKEEKIIGQSKILGDLLLERMVFSESREELVIVVLDGNSIMLDCVPKNLFS